MTPQKHENKDGVSTVVLLASFIFFFVILCASDFVRQCAIILRDIADATIDANANAFTQQNKPQHQDQKEGV